MQLIPPALVPAVQAYLASQGQPMVIDGNGNLDAGGVLGLFYNTVEVRTNVTPPIRFPISASGPQQSGPMRELVAGLQPTLIFSGPAGSQQVAPFGSAQGETSWLPIAAIGTVVILGIGYLIFD